jgi:hypothetical protein
MIIVNVQLIMIPVLILLFVAYNPKHVYMSVSALPILHHQHHHHHHHQQPLLLPKQKCTRASTYYIHNRNRYNIEKYNNNFCCTWTSTGTGTDRFWNFLPVCINAHYGQRLSRDDSNHSNMNSRNNINTNTNNNKNNNNNIDLSNIEDHVISSVQSQMDMSRILQSLSPDEPTARIQQRVDHNNMDDLLYDYEKNDPSYQRYIKKVTIVSQWQVALAAAIVCGTVLLLVIHNGILAIIVSITVFSIALFDTDTNSSNNENETYSWTGALIRILGRNSIRSMIQVEPKLKAMARVMVTDEEYVYQLQTTIKFLQDENEQLKLENQQLIDQLQRQQQINSLITQYTIQELKDLCKLHNIPIKTITRARTSQTKYTTGTPSSTGTGNTKIDLLEKLIAMNIIRLE